MKNALHSYALADLNEHLGVVDEEHPSWDRLCEIKSEPKNLGIRFPHSNETGGYERIRKLVELEGTNAVRIDLARFIANDDNLQTVLQFKFGNEPKHLWKGLGLSKHEIAKLIPGEWPFCIEDHPFQVFLEGELAFLMGLEDETMSLIHLRPAQPEVSCRSSACKMVPTVCKQYPAHIYKQRRDWKMLFQDSIREIFCPRLYRAK